MSLRDEFALLVTTNGLDHDPLGFVRGFSGYWDLDVPGVGAAPVRGKT